MAKIAVNAKKPALEKRLNVVKTDIGGLHKTIRYTLLCSRLMGLVPLSGLTCSTSDKLKFTLKSPYTVVYVISIFGQTVLSAMSLYWVFVNGISLTNVTNSLFYSTGLVSALILAYIGHHWPKLTAKVEKIENSLPPFNRNVAMFCNVIMALLLICAVAEYFSSKLYDLTVAKACDSENLWPTYFQYNMPWIFDYTEYSLWKGVLIEGSGSKISMKYVSDSDENRTDDFWSGDRVPVRYVTPARYTDDKMVAGISYSYTKGEGSDLSLNADKVMVIYNIQSTFMWTYNDLLIIIVSIYLAEHFIIHNHLLKKALKQDHFSCDEFRTQYLKIVRLVNMFNGYIGIYILTSFGVNLYWICTQLFFNLKTNFTGHVIACQFTNRTKDDILHGIEHSIYFTYSFSFLVARTLLVLLFAARVHSASVRPLFMLYEVPTTKYNIEVERFIDQINNLKVALSGMDFFYVTRTMILTLLGTIITYELVLLQFNK